MRIDKQKLIDLLVEKTQMGRDEIQIQLEQLIERILDAAKRGKALEIKEFGVFYFDEEGLLSFDPSDELSTEISFKYAGMKPVELKPERDTSISGQEEETEDELNDLFAEESDTLKADEEVEHEEDTEERDEEKDEFDDSLYDPFAPEALEPLEEPVEEDPNATTLDDIKPVSSRRPIKRKKDNTGIFILIGIILVAVIIGGYFYYIGTQTDDLDERTESTAQMDSPLMDEEMTDTDEGVAITEAENDEQEAIDEETGQVSETTEQPDTNEVSEEEIVSDTGVPITQNDQSLYGLTGSIVEEANDGYSIVLHSFTREDRARSAASRLRDDGYRVSVTSRTVYENMVWRVSVGQFETLGDAQQATTQLPNPYNTQNFIQRIRTN